MAETTENQEPSMEEILASIRRIISEDGATVQPAPTEAADVPVLDLVEEVKSDGSVAPVAEPGPAPVIEMEEDLPPAPEPAFTPTLTAAPAMADVPDMDRLISDSTANAASSALSGLAGMVRHNSGVTSLPLGNGGQTLENMVLDIIRPVLKDWLDRNLPTLVERVVQKEIQKITRDLG